MGNQLSREDHKREAINWLVAARSKGDAPACIVELHHHLEKGFWTLGDIGTSEEDLKTVERNYHKREATSLLVAAQSVGNAPACIVTMRNHLKKGNWTLANIGTSEVALKMVVRNYHKREAVRWLEAARDKGEAPGCVVDVRDHLKRGNWTLADIGTSEDGLKMVVRNYHKREAVRWLLSAQNIAVTPACIKYLRYHLSQGNWTVTDIGTSEVALQALITKHDTNQQYA